MAPEITTKKILKNLEKFVLDSAFPTLVHLEDLKTLFSSRFLIKIQPQIN